MANIGLMHFPILKSRVIDFTIRISIPYAIYNTLNVLVLLSALFRIAFSKWASVIFLFMEIIQLIAINADHELQHIVDQRRKPCRVIS